MEPEVRTSGIVNIVKVTGKLTMGSGATEGLGTAIRDLLHGGRKSILLDLAGVSYIDSASLGVLLAHYKRTVERGGILKLLKPADKVREVLALTELDKVLEVFQDEAEAVASF